jgi:hypothetical protein
MTQTEKEKINTTHDFRFPSRSRRELLSSVFLAAKVVIPYRRFGTHIAFCTLAQAFSSLSHKRHDFGKKQKKKNEINVF